MARPTSDLPMLVLAILMHTERHGYGIAKEIQTRSDGVLNFKGGAIYPLLITLEADGFIVGRDVTEQRHIVRYYKLTEKGERKCTADREAFDRTTRAKQKIIGGLIENV